MAVTPPGYPTNRSEDCQTPLLARREFGDGAFDATDLGDVGEVDVVVEGRRGHQAALLQAPVALIQGRGAQGGNAPRSGR